MKTNKKTMMIAAAVVITIALASYFAYKFMFKPKSVGDAGTSAETGGFSYGSEGSQIELLQEGLNKHGANLAVDGIWGPLTDAAVQNHFNKTIVTNQDIMSL